ncbi:MAG: hypothetical protein AAF628_17150 [Planctomycetota bacterium]
MIAPLLALLSLQAVSPAAGAAPSAAATPVVHAVVQLRSGATIEGAVKLETEDYLELRLGRDTLVGFDKARIVAIERRDAAAPAPPRAALDERDEWFVLHDAQGNAVGCLHATVTIDADRCVRLAEEWEFREEGHTIGITSLEVVTADLRPVSCFYHERRRRQVDAQTSQERLVRATVEGEELAVETSTLLDRTRRRWTWREGMRFPLAALEELRQHPPPTGRSIELALFDPAREEMLSRRFAGGVRRRIDLDDREIEVREVSYQVQQQVNVEWVDASARLVRREVNGPCLVAVRSTEAKAARWSFIDRPLSPMALVVDPARHFGLWLPNPVWREAALEEGSITVAAPQHDASVRFAVIRDIDEDLLLDSIAEVVARRLGLGRQGWQLEERSAVQVRNRDAVRLVGTYDGPTGTRLTRRRCEVYVLSAEGRDLTLCCDAPEPEFPRLRLDFERIRESLELHPAAVAVESARAGPR